MHQEFNRNFMKRCFFSKTCSPSLFTEDYCRSDVEYLENIVVRSVFPLFFSINAIQFGERF